MGGGRHIKYDKHTPLSNLHLTILNKVGIQLDRFSDSSGKADELFGRALGRVVAHELYHMLTNTGKHGKSGIARDSLSAQQLIGETLDFSAHERVALAGKRDFRK